MGINPQATIWNPNTGDKQVIDTGGAMPQGYSLWTGGTASGQQARQAIMDAKQPVQPATAAPAVTPPASTPVLPTTPSNVINSGTLATGINNSSISSSLPSNNSGQISNYANTSLNEATTANQDLQTKLNTMAGANSQDPLQALRSAKAGQLDNQTNLQNQAFNQDSNYNDQMTGMRNSVIGFDSQAITTASNQNAQALTQNKIDINNQIADYARASAQLVSSNQTPGLTSTITAQTTAQANKYNAQISLLKSASTALDGNLNLANDLLANASDALQKNITQQKDFITMTASMFSGEITNSDKIIASLDSQIKDVQTNQAVVSKLMESNPIVVTKSGIALTDSPNTVNQKLTDFYTKNPQYTPDNQAWLKATMDKYPDAGITSDDTIATAQSKLQKDPSYLSTIKPVVIGKDANSQDIYGTFNPQSNSYVALDNSTNGQLNDQGKVATSTGQIYDMGNYAVNDDGTTNMGAINNVQAILDKIGTFTSGQDITDFIKQNYPNSPITAEDVMTAAYGNGVSPEMVVATMAAETQMGTDGSKGSKGYNFGNVGNTNTLMKNGGSVDMPTPLAGVTAVAKNLAKRLSGSQAPTSTDITFDAAPPKPETANIVDPNYGVTPNALYQNAISFAEQGGSIKTFVASMASSGKTLTARQNANLALAIQSKAAAMASAAGTDLGTLRAQYKSNVSALTQQTQYANTMQRSLNNADAGSAQLLQLFKNANINTSDATILNTKVNDLTKSFGNSTDIRAYQSALAEISNEYAQVFSRGNISTDATRQTAKDILDGNITLGALQKSVDTIKAIGETNIKGNWQQVNAISSTLANFLKVTGQINPDTSGAGAGGAGASGIGRWQSAQSGQTSDVNSSGGNNLNSSNNGGMVGQISKLSGKNISNSSLSSGIATGAKNVWNNVMSWFK